MACALDSKASEVIRFFWGGGWETDWNCICNSTLLSNLCQNFAFNEKHPIALIPVVLVIQYRVVWITCGSMLFYWMKKNSMRVDKWWQDFHFCLNYSINNRSKPPLSLIVHLLMDILNTVDHRDSLLLGWIIFSPWDLLYTSRIKFRCVGSAALSENSRSNECSAKQWIVYGKDE